MIIPLLSLLLLLIIIISNFSLAWELTGICLEELITTAVQDHKNYSGFWGGSEVEDGGGCAVEDGVESQCFEMSEMYMGQVAIVRKIWGVGREGWHMSS